MFSWVVNFSSMYVVCFMWSYLMGILWLSLLKCVYEVLECEILLSVKFDLF